MSMHEVAVIAHHLHLFRNCRDQADRALALTVADPFCVELAVLHDPKNLGGNVANLEELAP